MLTRIRRDIEEFQIYKNENPMGYKFLQKAEEIK